MDGEIIFIFYFDAPLYIQVDKGLDVVLTAVNVIGHRIMGRIQKPLADMKIRKESFHPEPGFPGIQWNHVLRQDSTVEKQEGRFSSWRRQAYISRSRNKSNPRKNPTQYHSQAGKRNGRRNNPRSLSAFAPF